MTWSKSWMKNAIKFKILGSSSMVFSYSDIFLYFGDNKIRESSKTLL
jgi:hypothetical protein